jgi:protein tyrosine/serine phosphatase
VNDDARWLALEGAANARDLGGLPLAGGGRTASGVLLRADNLQDLTPADVRRLVDDLGLRLVIDLRTGIEVAREGPGPLVRDGRAEIRHRSLYPESGTHTDVDVTAVMPWIERRRNGVAEETPAVRAYLGYLRDRPDSIVAALCDAARSGGPAIVHCAAGKDRTGIVCALALAVAGATRAAIVTDYVATGERMERLLARLRSSPTYAPDLDGSPASAHMPRAEAMERVLDVLDERHGGPLGWLEEAGFAADDAARLRARLTGAAAADGPP